METWQARLERGDTDGAWTAFDRAYQRLIHTVIRRLETHPDQVDEVRSEVTAALAADRLARLRRYSSDDPSGATLSSWLVVVVRRLVIDWLRRERGRHRNDVPTDLEGWQRAMYIARCLERLSVAESFERLRGQRNEDLDFPLFLRELRTLARSHPCPEFRPARDAVTVPVPFDLAVSVADPGEAVDLSRRLGVLLAEEPADLRLAIQLFVVDELPASEVSRVVGWPDAKAVYNRVGRALHRMRETLMRAGIESGDL
jgi:RNA polymerase sigma factor (sigma-70 family)